MKYLAISALILVSGCSWFRGVNDWANEKMPTYDGSRPGLEKKNEAQAPLPTYHSTTNPNVPAAAPTLPPQEDRSYLQPNNFNSAAVPTGQNQQDYYDSVIPSATTR